MLTRCWLLLHEELIPHFVTLFDHVLFRKKQFVSALLAAGQQVKQAAWKQGIAFPLRSIVCVLLSLEYEQAHIVTAYC